MSGPVILYRRGSRREWRFEWDRKLRRWTYTTERGTTYVAQSATICGHCYRLIEIYRQVNGTWVGWSKELRAERVLLPDGSEYRFPPAKGGA